MAQFTITLSGTLPGTDTELEQKSMTLDVKDAEKHTINLGTSYVTIADGGKQSWARMHVAVRNDGAESVRLRIYDGSSNYTIMTVPAGQLAFIPARMSMAVGSADFFPVLGIDARALTSACRVTVLTMYG